MSVCIVEIHLDIVRFSPVIGFKHIKDEEYPKIEAMKIVFTFTVLSICKPVDTPTIEDQPFTCDRLPTFFLYTCVHVF